VGNHWPEHPHDSHQFIFPVLVFQVRLRENHANRVQEFPEFFSRGRREHYNKLGLDQYLPKRLLQRKDDELYATLNICDPGNFCDSIFPHVTFAPPNQPLNNGSVCDKICDNPRAASVGYVRIGRDRDLRLLNGDQ
jgi:hypothetical protein